MDFNEEKLEKIVKLLKTQGFSVKPEANGLADILAKIEITVSPEMRYTNKEVNIISPFYNYMSNSMKVLVSLVVVALLAGGVAYFNLAGPTIVGGPDIAVNGDEDLGSLLASLGQEQSEEAILLATEEVDGSTLVNESLLLGEINQTYQNEL